MSQQLYDQRSRVAFLAARFLEPRSRRLAFGNTSRDLDADASRDELRCAVGRYVRELRDLGDPPERVIIEVKEFAADVIRLCDVQDVEGREKVSEDFVRWTIEAYYSTT